MAANGPSEEPTMPHPTHRHLALAGPIMASALALAACGSGGPGNKHAAHSPQLAMAQCMRAHGVPNYPDPITGPGGQGFSISSAVGNTSTVTVNGITLSGPEFEAAEKNCKLFGGGSGPPPVSEAQKIALFHFAQCMRTHGVPSYPDPTFPAGGGIGRPAIPGLSPDAPAVARAAAECNHH